MFPLPNLACVCSGDIRFWPGRTQVLLEKGIGKVVENVRVRHGGAMFSGRAGHYDINAYSRALA